MLTRLGLHRGFGWPDWERELALLDSFRREVNRIFEGSPAYTVSRGADPLRTNLYDAGDHFVITADVPGLKADDVQVSLQNDVLSISGSRDVEAPEGFSVHRQERPSYSFSRSYTLPCPVDAEKATATVANGVLTLQLAKRPELQPRQIKVRS